MCQTKSGETVCYCDRRNAKNFLDVLVEEGSREKCDETSENFRKGMDIPEFYDEKKFKRAQQFFHDNIFAMFHAKLLGLMADLSLIYSQKILQYTNQSSEPITAYRRYISTIFSMYCWYTCDLRPGSKSWDSLKRIRNMHNFASLNARSNNIDQITQYHMALAQFGFMGLVVTKWRKIGIHDPKVEDMEAFVHFWRVIGHMLGMKDRYNICKGSFKETKEICDKIAREIFAPSINQWNPIFLKMTQALVEGLWAMMPVLQTKVWVVILNKLLNDDNNNNSNAEVEILKLSFLEKCMLKIVIVAIYFLQFDTFRTLQKYNMYLMLYLSQKFPFLAYYKFGLDYRHTKFVETLKISYWNPH